MNFDYEEKYNSLIKDIREQILPLMEKAITDDKVVFENKNLKKCWSEKNCSYEECPVLKENHNLRCWQVAGTYCGGKTQGLFVDKYSNCKNCDIYKKACPTILEELGEAFNNLLFLIKKEKNYNRRKMDEIAYLNKELSSTLENLDKKNRAIQELVIIDKLTGVFNRTYLFTVLEDELMRFERTKSIFCVLMMDIDDFKKVNDRYGHIAGDRVLSSLGKMFQSVLRKSDRVFRYGGEEFVVLLTDTEVIIANIIADKIRAAAENNAVKVLVENTEIELKTTLSIGISSFNEGLSAEKLLQEADKAMYVAKAQGKNRVIRFDLIS